MRNKYINVLFIYFQFVCWDANSQIIVDVYDTSNSGLVSNSVEDIVIDSQNIIWVATTSGLSKFDGVTWTTYNDVNSGLPNNSVTRLAVDSTNLWAGTTDGLAKFDGTNWTVFDTSNSTLRVNRIISLAIDQNSNIWVGTSGSPFISNLGLAKYDGTTWTVYDTSNSPLTISPIEVIEIDNNGDVWVVSGWKVVKFDGTTWTEYDTISTFVSNVNAIAFEADGDIWFGAGGVCGFNCTSVMNGGMVKFDGVDYTYYQASNNLITNIIIDSCGNKWIATGKVWDTPVGALSKFDDTTFTHFDTSNTTMSPWGGRPLAIDSCGKIWFGTRDGLLVFTDSSCTKCNCNNLNANFTQNKDTIDLALSETIQFTDSSTNVLQWNWNFGDGNTDTTQNPNHTYDTTGTYIVILIVSNGICSDTAISTIEVINTVGISDMNNKEFIQIYPNPNRGEFTIEIDLQKSSRLSINIYQIYGRLIYTNEFINITGNYSQQLDLSKYAKGMYYVQIVTDSGVFTRKVVYQ